MKYLRFRIHDSLFKADFFVQLGGNSQQAVDWFAEEINTDRFLCSQSPASGRFFENDMHHGGCIWIEKLTDVLALTHECLHATHYALRRLRIELREDTEEVFCYYQEWLLKEISERVKLKLIGKIKWKNAVIKKKRVARKTR